MSQEHKAGDKMFVDFAGLTRSYIDGVSGEVRQAHIFVAILGASQLTWIEALPDQRQETFVAGCAHALHYIGGVPRAIVPDNLKSAVTTASKYEPGINALFDQFAEWHRTAILPARPWRPKDKPLVEGMVKIMYRWILAPFRNRTFYSLAELNAAIRERLEILNNRIMKRFGKSRRELFEAIERMELQPLPALPYPLQQWRRVRAGFNYHVYLADDKHYYSVPYAFRGNEIDVFYTQRTVELFCRRKRLCVHVRDTRPHRYSTTPEHMPPHHRYVAEWSPERIMAWAGEIGPQATELVRRLMQYKPHPEQGFRGATGVINLKKKYGAARVDQACGRAVAFGAYTYAAVEKILESGLEKNAVEQQHFDALPAHENVRGGKAYEEAEG